jgi:predicted MFS family arabinose efflux permease
MNYNNKHYRYYVLGLLTIGYVFSFIDRQILAILQEPIKLELGLSDSQLGLISGFSFALFYVVLGLPIARWADKGSRRGIVALAVGVWSLMTVFCGMAQNFWQMLLARIGVAAGEAGGSPPSHSLISDIFAPEKRATALGVYSIGVNVGILFGFLAGGWLNHLYGWRMTFFIVGVPGIALALLMRYTIREPERGFSEGRSGDSSATDKAAPPMMAVVRHLISMPSFRHLAVGSGLAAFAGYAAANWMPSFLMRSYQLDSADIGTWLALFAGVGGAIGTFSGSWLADRLSVRDIRWYAWTPAVALALATPLVFLTFWAGSFEATMAAHLFPACVTTLYLAPVIAVTHRLVENRMRALASAILFLVLNIIGLGLGPLMVGMLSDALSASLGVESLRQSLLILGTLATCWSALHFFLGARYLKSDLARAAVAAEERQAQAQRYANA